MASTINGTSTGNGGLISTGDDSGILNIQTNETTAITVDASQRAAFVAGTAALPAITTDGDTNTGIWFPAADTIAFTEGGTESMRIDSSGNVGIGTSSPSVKLDVATSTAGFATILTNTNGASDSNGLYIKSGTGSTEYNLRLSNTSGSTDFMAVKGNGNVGIGTSSPTARLTVSDSADGAQSGTIRLGDNGTYYGENLFRYNSSEYRIGVYPSGNMTFYATGSENMRLTSSGNLLVGTTSLSFGERLSVKSVGTSSASDGVLISNSAGTTLFRVRSDGAFQTGAAAVSPYNNTTGSAANTFVNTDGTLLRSTSSLKYKKDIADATHGLTDLLKLRSVTYKGKNEADGEKTFGGLIAEEVHDAGLTEFVHYSTDGTPDALNYGNMVALCVKAIQELKAINDTQAATITALTARITALENA